VNGGVEFFGFTDPTASILAVTITNIGNDAWGIDDVQYNSIPEPATMVLMGGGLVAAALIRRRFNR
jgi:hypothetical protein